MKPGPIHLRRHGVLLLALPDEGPLYSRKYLMDIVAGWSAG
jgi:hypothetical protein